MNSTPEPRTAEARIRTYLRLLPSAQNLGGEIAYSEEFRSDDWPRSCYAPTRDDVEALLAGLARAQAEAYQYRTALQGAARAATAPASVPPAQERRDRYAQALADVDGWKWAEGFKEHSPTWQRYQRRADAVLAVADAEQADTRAAALRDFLFRLEQSAGDAVAEKLLDDNPDLAAVLQEPEPQTAAPHPPTTEYRVETRMDDTWTSLGAPLDLSAARRIYTDYLRGYPDAEMRILHCTRTTVAIEQTVPARTAAVLPQPETQAGTEAEPEFTEARAAFMQIGRTPSLEGLRAELRIEGWPPIVGRYCGASMGRMHDVPGHEHLLAVDPRLIFEYADREQPAVVSQPEEAEAPRETVHACPPDGSGLTPCCGRTPFELPLGDRISSEATVTCHGAVVSQPDEEAGRIVAYRSPQGCSLYCVRHRDELFGAGFTPVASDDLPDGGLCTFPDCGADVLIPQQPDEEA